MLDATTIDWALQFLRQSWWRLAKVAKRETQRLSCQTGTAWRIAT